MKKFTPTTVFIFIAFFLFLKNANGAYRCSCTSGNWASASTWTPSGTVGCGDSVVIEAGHTVSFTTQQNYGGCALPLKIIVKGKMKFFLGSKLTLPCGSYIIVYQGGRIEADQGLQNSNFIEICGNIEWNSNAPLDGPACIPASDPVCQKVLPVELVSFGATSISGRVLLNWETATENNNDYFVVERSANARDFRTVFSVHSKSLNGNSTVRNYYSGYDNGPDPGTNYYRLKQVDRNHTYSFSDVISIQTYIENGLQFVICPSVNTGEFTAQISGVRSAGPVNILLRDETGSIVYKAFQYVDDQTTQLRVAPPQRLPNGFYFCSFILSNKEYVVKMLVSNS
jgi:hypothetical protein